MVCYSPIRGYWSGRKHPSTGNRYLVFSPSQSNTTDYLCVPCGKCPGCLLDRSFAWSVRCTCESLYHSESYFLTLTYSPENLPDDKLLNRVHVQLFLKRLRKHFTGYKLRVFYCGEYGEDRFRPHYHMVVFGLPLSEKNYRLYPINSSKRGNLNYYNEKINQLWGKGLCTIGTFSSASASYVAQYTFKKQKIVTGDSAVDKVVYIRRRRAGIDLKSRLGLPFIGMSNRPGIGQKYFDDHWREIFRNNQFSIQLGSEVKHIRPLRYFVKKLKDLHPIQYHTYITRVARLRRFKDDVEMHKSDKIANLLDKKFLNRYIKEQRTLRKIEARSDL